MEDMYKNAREKMQVIESEKTIAAALSMRQRIEARLDDGGNILAKYFSCDARNELKNTNTPISGRAERGSVVRREVARHERQRAIGDAQCDRARALVAEHIHEAGGDRGALQVVHEALQPPPRKDKEANLPEGLGGDEVEIRGRPRGGGGGGG